MHPAWEGLHKTPLFLSPAAKLVLWFWFGDGSSGFRGIYGLDSKLQSSALGAPLGVSSLGRVQSGVGWQKGSGLRLDGPG